MLSFDENCLNHYSDEDLLEFFKNPGPRLGSPPCRIRLLSPNLVAKGVQSKTLPDTVKAQSLARDLSIRVPEIRRTITKKNRSYIIMDRVHGVTLEACWSRLGWIATIRLAFEL
jgi:hypothetical protein